MKVRISNNKIRFRLKEPEVKLFDQTGIATEALQFGVDESQHLKFVLQENDENTLRVNFDLNIVTVFIPKEQAKQWTSTDSVGFEAEVDTGKGKIITVLVEKDFMCMDGREEDNVGSYPNPLAATSLND